MAALVTVLVVCLAGLTAVATQIRCVDAAREAARLAARGDDGGDVARDLAPHGAAVAIRRDGEFVIATVTAPTAVLPGLAIEARAVAAVEPASR